MKEIQNPVIGVTERGDAGYDMGWVEPIRTGTVDAAVLITKSITNLMLRNLADLTREGFQNIILHCGCTGRGGTVLEPCAPDYMTQLRSLQAALDADFPLERCVLRIDPIIPDKDGLNAAWLVLRDASAMFDMKKLRVRISVMDDYKHVKARFRAAGLEPVYPDDQFYASREQFGQVQRLCGMYPDIQFETCAERFLQGPNIQAMGCISDRDLALCGIRRTGSAGVNPQNRSGCLCLSGKRELLANRRQCPNKCLYCYWR